MKNWRTTIGGSIQTLGTTLMGAGVVPSLVSYEAASHLQWLVISGFVLKAIGEMVTAIFSADAKVVNGKVTKSEVDVEIKGQ